MASSAVYSFQKLPLSAFGVGSRRMQSTGQTGRQRSQPVQNEIMTECMYFAAPTMASTGQAWMQSVQPVQLGSSTTAYCRLEAVPTSPLRFLGSLPESLASPPSVTLSPGGQRLILAFPSAIASAYSKQPGYPHWVQWIWGNQRSKSEVVGRLGSMLLMGVVVRVKPWP